MSENTQPDDVSTSASEQAPDGGHPESHFDAGAPDVSTLADLPAPTGATAADVAAPDTNPSGNADATVEMTAPEPDAIDRLLAEHEERTEGTLPGVLVDDDHQPADVAAELIGTTDGDGENAETEIVDDPTTIESPVADDSTTDATAPADDLTGDVDTGDVETRDVETRDDADPDSDPDDDEAVTFADLGLSDDVLEQLTKLGYEHPTPIQAESIPPLLDGFDVLGQAATGTGKTAAFALPMLDRVAGLKKSKLPFGLVLVPTRELANQVAEAFKEYGATGRVRMAALFGGTNIGPQFSLLNAGVDIVIGTPGRVLDHLKRGSLDLSNCGMVVLDEADEMLDMGFTDDIESILESTPEDRQTVMFSATMPPRINSIAKRHQRDPHKIKIGKAETQESQKLINQRVYYVKRNDKPYALGRILDIETPDAAIVFCRTRMDVDQLTATMGLRGYRAEALHGGMDQTQRDRVMARLRDGTAELLVATDVAARGLDVDTLTHVVNYDVPAAAESYVHRIGRVGRAGREGTAITLADPRDRRQLGNIERLMKTTIEVGTVPSVADLRARQVELTVNQIRESLTSVDLEDFNKVLHALAGEDSDRNIALAAIKLVHESRGAVMDEREIPDASVRNDRSEKWKDKRADGKGRHRDDRNWDDNKAKGKKKFDRDDRKGKKRDFDNSDTAFVFISLGRKSGVRPGDLVGAIANESGLTGRQIGPIRISEQHSVVGVPKDEVDRVINAMDRATMRGKPVKARPYVD